MNLAAALREECIAADRRLPNKTEVLAEIARLAAHSPTLAGVEEREILSALREREALGSTGFGNEVAIPHCRLPGAQDFTVGALTLSEGVEFDSIDGSRVKVCVFFVGPPEVSEGHIRLLSTISQNLTRRAVFDELVAARTPAAIRESLLRHCGIVLEGGKRAPQSLFCVVCQNEELFENVLQVFSGLQTTCEVVVEARPSREYLVKVPLFAALAGEWRSGFCRIILAAVEKTMTNEALRRIDHVAGDLEKSTDIAVFVQEASYVAGSVSL